MKLSEKLSGLASSSRNYRLSEQELEDAIIINQMMVLMQSLAKRFNPARTKEIALEYFNKGELKLEYLNIVNPETLLEIDQWVPGTRACLAAYCGEVRLIDNMEIVPED